MPAASPPPGLQRHAQFKSPRLWTSLQAAPSVGGDTHATRDQPLASEADGAATADGEVEGDGGVMGGEEVCFDLGAALVWLAEDGEPRVGGGAGVAEAGRGGGEVRWCRDRSSPTGDLGNRGVRGAVGLGYRFTA